MWLSGRVALVGWPGARDADGADGAGRRWERDLTGEDLSGRSNMRLDRSLLGMMRAQAKKGLIENRPCDKTHPVPFPRPPISLFLLCTSRPWWAS